MFLDVFSRWWSQTKLSKDFWIEKDDTFIRIHVVPRRGLFNPESWVTSQCDVKERLLGSIGVVRSTTAISCETHHPLQSIHDTWQSDTKASYPTLWVGRTVFARVRHPGRQCVSPEDLLESDGQQGRSEEPVEDDQARASSGGSTAGLPGASQLDRGRGAPGRDRQDAATHGHRQHAKGTDTDDACPAHGHSSRDGVDASGQAHKGPDDPGNPGQCREPSRHRGILRPLSRAALPRGAGVLPTMEHHGDGGEPGQRLTGPDSPGQLRQDETQRGGDPRPGGRSTRALHPVTRGHQVRFERVVDSLRADPGERVPEEEPRTSRGKGQGVSRSPEGHAISSRSTSDCQTTGARVGSEADTHEAGCAGGSPGGDQPAHGTPGSPPRQARDVDQSDFDSEARLEDSIRPRAAPQDSYEHDVGPYDSEQPGDDKCCDCLEVTSDDLDGLSVDAFARRLWQIKDFSHASCEKILKHVCSECQAARKRKINEGTASVAFGAYSHGNHYGVIQKTCIYPNVSIYINRFLKHHGAKGSWSSVQLGWNCPVGAHKDVHNLSDTLNWNITLGNFSGGRLWLESTVSTSQASKDQQVQLCDGTMAIGPVVDTKGQVHAFDPKRRHGVEQWSGDRATITAYTTRGVGHLSRQERDLLRSFGFPVGQDAGPNQPPADEPHHVEHRQRPKKSVRRTLWKSAQRASAMFTIGLAAASSFVSEILPHGSDPARASLYEIGGHDLTCDIAGFGSTVIEPLSWKDFLQDTDNEKVVDTITALKPHVVWVQGHGRGLDAIAHLRKTADVQIGEGGMFVCQDDITAGFWKAPLLEYFVEAYPCSFEDKAQTRIIRVGSQVRPHDDVHPPPSQAVNVTSHEDGHGAQSGQHSNSSVKEIKFEGNVPKHVQSALIRLHQNLGHPSAQDMARHLRYVGADEHVVKACKNLRCQVCDRNRHTGTPRPATLPSLLDMNQLVSIDVFHVFDADRVRHELLSVIDHATTFQLVCKIEGHSAAEFTKKFTQLWGNVFGSPGTISADLETGLQAGLAKYAEFHGCKIRSAAGQAHWQQGVIERHGLWFQEIIKRVIDEKSIGAEDIDLAIQACNSAKNELRRRHGFSPNQAVFGRDPRVAEELCSGGDEERFIELMSQDRQRQKEVAIRTAARMAFFRTQLDTKFRRSLLQRARVKRGGYRIGELVCFYRIEKVATKRGQWRGPGTIIGSEGGNWWVSFAGRCHLVAEEHLRPSTAEELGDILSTKIARDDLEKLLNLDPDDPATYQDNPDPEQGDVDLDPEQESQQDIDMDFQFSLEPEQDVFNPDAEMTIEGSASASSAPRREKDRDPRNPPVVVSKRVRIKGPAEKAQSVNMLKRCYTERSLAKQYEKELPWKVIPESEHQGFREAEDKQFREHLHHQALDPISLEESRAIRQRVDPSRILSSRFAYKDKNWTRRKLDESLPWKHKARLVIGGHRDPDVHMLQTDAPTINRLSVLTLLQLVASKRAKEGWSASAGDIEAAFLNGDPLERELYLAQPRTGLAGLHPEQLLRITKGVFGLPDSPRKWWRRLRGDMLGISIVHEGQKYKLLQSPLDACLFQLVKDSFDPADLKPEEPVGYVGVHVDDLLVAGGPVFSRLIQEALSNIFPVGEWLVDDFDYLGSHIKVDDQGVFFSQEAYASSRLFEIPISTEQKDEDPATEEQRIDNQSLVGALSWLSSQSRPDLQCSVSLAQQLQSNPSVGDLRFSNQIARRAWDHRDKGIWLRPLVLSQLEFLVYHDAAWGNAKLSGEEGFRLSQADHELGTMTGSPYDWKERKAKRANSCVASQLGVLLVLTDTEHYRKGGQVCSVLDWKSCATQRVCRSTFGAETTGCIEAVETGQYIRSYVQTIITGKLQRVESLAGGRLKCITDCKSLYDHLHKEGVPKIPSDKRLAIDLSALRQSLDLEKVNDRTPLFWVPTGFQLADVLTKPKSSDQWWKEIYGSFRLPFKCLEEDAETSLKL